MYLSYIFKELGTDLKRWGTLSLALLFFLHLILQLTFAASSLLKTSLQEVFLDHRGALFFKLGTSPQKQQQVLAQLKAHTAIQEIQVLEAQNLLPANHLLPDVSQLPAVLQFLAHKDQLSSLSSTLAKLKDLNEVDEIFDPEQQNGRIRHLLGWIQSFSHGFALFTLALNVLFGFLLMFLIMEKRKTEIHLLKSLGADSHFIIAPQFLFFTLLQTCAFSLALLLLFMMRSWTLAASDSIAWLKPYATLLHQFQLSDFLWLGFASYLIFITLYILKSSYEIRRFFARYSALGILIVSLTLLPWLKGYALSHQMAKVQNEIQLIQKQVQIIENKCSTIQKQEGQFDYLKQLLTQNLIKHHYRLNYQMGDQTDSYQWRTQIIQYRQLQQLTKQTHEQIMQQKQGYQRLERDLRLRNKKLLALKNKLQQQSLPLLETRLSTDEAQIVVNKLMAAIPSSFYRQLKQPKERNFYVPLDATAVFSEFNPQDQHTIILEVEPQTHLIVSGLEKISHPNLATFKAGQWLGRFRPIGPKALQFRYKNQPLKMSWSQFKGGPP